MSNTPDPALAPLDLPRLVDGVTQLASPPEVYYRLEDAITRTAASLEEIGDIIASDPDLSARLLRMANSAFYGFPSKVESIARALVSIGTRQLRDLVLATTVVRLFSQLPFDRVNMQSFWRHSMHVGLVSRSIATTIGEPNDARFYVAGLLHDIGRLLMYLRAPSHMHHVLNRSGAEGRQVYAVEREVLGFDHGEAGGALLQAWRLPVSIVEPVRCHHRPEAASEYPVETEVVALADLCSRLADVAGDTFQPVPESDLRALERLGIGEPEIAAAVATADSQLDAMLAQFGLS